MGCLHAQMPYFHPDKNSRAGATDVYRNPLRVLLNQFSFTATTGYGTVLYSHQLNNQFYYVENEGQPYLIPSAGQAGPLRGEVRGYSNWFNSLSDPETFTYTFQPPYSPIDNPVLNPVLREQPADFKLRSYSLTVPLTVSAHFNAGRYRFGAGATLERQYFTEFRVVGHDEKIPFRPEVPPVFLQSYFGTIGYRFYDFWNFSFASELQFGRMSGGKRTFENVQRNNFYNFGIAIEQNLSEYFRVIIKPSYGYHSFNTIGENSFNMPHLQQTFSIQAGISINIPDIRRCPLPACHIQLKHVHSGEELRGQPIHKHQNPKMGQNHRKLFRYKWRNKRKMAPY